MLTLVCSLPLISELEGFTLSLPKVLHDYLVLRIRGSEYSHKNSFVLGASTFFLPCGFTQAMQLYAMSSGNVFSGALIMGVFAVGTTPGLLSIGGLTSVLREFLPKFF
jgi:sulfite exporter TauE/SafE